MELTPAEKLKQAGLMNDEEAIAAVHIGCRAVTEFSMHGKWNSKKWPHCRHHWRCIACDGGEWDVLECHNCGKQKLARCSMDEECR